MLRGRGENSKMGTRAQNVVGHSTMFYSLEGQPKENFTMSNPP